MSPTVKDSCPDRYVPGTLDEAVAGPAGFPSVHAPLEHRVVSLAFPVRLGVKACRGMCLIGALRAMEDRQYQLGVVSAPIASTSLDGAVHVIKRWQPTQEPYGKGQ